MNGYLNILKPPGMTSAAVVAVLRRLTGEKRIGHAGTLDPEAAGVLPVMIGKAARLFDYLVDKEKTYVAEVAFGQATDTQDATGTVIAEGDSYPDMAQVRAAAEKLTGDIWQTPSMFSAIKVGGKALHQLARKGETVEVPRRLVHVESISVTEELPNHGFLMTVHCGRGTYIRSICHDMGELVGCPAHMRFLLRAQSGAFDLATAMTVEEVTALQEQGVLAQHLLKPDYPLQHIPRADYPAKYRKQVKNGAKLPCLNEEIPQGGVVRIYLENEFWGMAAREDDMLTWRAQIAPEGESGT
ncbi:MAG: tRNA pseudouridine(55) synthase TruB [Clostridia bacterium]|nr:tRNA pseudouridine(55) synthase TruB [Clostridia bacterium]